MRPIYSSKTLLSKTTPEQEVGSHLVEIHISTKTPPCGYYKYKLTWLSQCPTHTPFMIDKYA